MNITDLENKHIKISSHSITCKNDNGKTCGVVRDITKFLDLQPNKQIKFTKALRLSGLWGNKYRLMDYVIYCDGKLYYINNLTRITNLQKYDKLEARNLSLLGEEVRNYFTVINCYVI